MDINQKLMNRAESINEQNWAEGEACIRTLMTYHPDLIEECLEKSQRAPKDGGVELLEFMQARNSNTVLVGNLCSIALGEIMLRIERQVAEAKSA